MTLPESPKIGSGGNMAEFHIGDIVEEVATKRRGKLDEAPQIPTDVRRWRVLFSDDAQPILKYFLSQTELILISCPHSEAKAPGFVPERGIMG